jgi:hypothetical protein
MQKSYRHVNLSRGETENKVKHLAAGSAASSSQHIDVFRFNASVSFAPRACLSG